MGSQSKIPWIISPFKTFFKFPDFSLKFSLIFHVYGNSAVFVL